MSLIDKTVTVRRGGSYLTIPATAIDRYLAKGYDVVDENDDIVLESVPNDVNALKRAFDAHVKKIHALEAEIETLKSQKTEAETEAPAAKKTAPKKRA